MEISVISLKELSSIVEYDFKAWNTILGMIEDNSESSKDRIGKVFYYLIIHHIETGIGQMHREDRNWINATIERGYDSDVVNDRLRRVYINTLRNRLNRLDKLGDAIKEQLDSIGVDYTDDDDED